MDVLLGIITPSKNSDCIIQTAVGHGDDKYATKYFVGDMNAFWLAYDDIVQSKIPVPLYFMERPTLSYSILRFDIDLKPQVGVLPTTKRLYTQTFVQDFIHEVHTQLQQLVNARICDASLVQISKHYTCAVFTKREWRDRDGLHFCFPHLFCEHQLQNHIVRAMQNWADTYDLSLSGCKSISVDRISTKPWVMLGSRKSQTSHIYSLAVVYNSVMREIDDTLYAVPSTYSVNRQSLVYYKTNIPHTSINVIAVRPLDAIDKDYEQLSNCRASNTRNFMDLLSAERADNYDDWLDVGIILFNIGNGQNRFLDMWKYFSEKSDKYDERVCDKKWASFRLGNRTFGSLMYLLRIDSPHKFHDMLESRNVEYLRKHLLGDTDQFLDKLKKNSITDALISQIFHARFSLDLLYAPSRNGKGQWYRFKVNRWVEQHDEDIKELIIGDVKDYIINIFSELESDVRNVREETMTDEGVEEEDGDDTAKLIWRQKQNAINKIETNGTLGTIFNYSKILFKNNDFAKFKDANKYLLGCENGVLDMHPEKMCFRPANPDDYITKSTGVQYRVPSHKELTELDTFFGRLFVDEDVRVNFLEIIASMLLGGNSEKIILVALGETNVGKTQMVKFLQKTLGHYGVVLPTEIVYNRKMSSSQARPELTRTEGSRICFINELAEGETMNVAALKQFSGADEIFARDLFSSGSQLVTLFTLYLSCNYVPSIPNKDEAMWGRMVIVKFLSTFTDEAPDDPEEQKRRRRFPRSKDMEEFFQRMAPVLLYKLFETFKNNSVKFVNGVERCATIREYTNNFRNSSNPMNYFIRDKIEDATEDDVVKVPQLYEIYKTWFVLNYPSTKVPSREDFLTDFIRVGGGKWVVSGTMSRKVITNLKFRTD